jgi:hypothetical protein
MFKKFATLALLCALGYGAYRFAVSGSSEVGASDEPGLINDRAWFEKQPEKPTEYVHAAIFIESAKVGVFQRASAYDYRGELFEMKRDKENVSVVFPQSGRATQFSFTVKTCSDRKPFDLCLDLTANPWGGPRRYYGFRADEDSQKLQDTGSIAAELRERVKSVGGAAK